MTPRSTLSVMWRCTMSSSEVKIAALEKRVAELEKTLADHVTATRMASEKLRECVQKQAAIIENLRNCIVGDGK